MSINEETVHLTEQAISTSRDHLVYLNSCGLADYPSVDQILEGAKVVAEYLSQNKEANPDVKLYALDFAFGYSYERNQETGANPEVSFESIISIARQIEEAFPSICPQ